MKIENELILENSEQLNILYVEDNELLRNATKNIFLIYFKGVDTAIDGREGLEKFLLHKKNNGEYYDLVISDINMPRMSGIEMCAAIMDENPVQSIILNTAHNEASFLQEAISLGVDGFLTKPIHLNQFKKVLYKITKAIMNRKRVEALHKGLELQVFEQKQRLEAFYKEDKLTGLGNLNALQSRINEGRKIAVTLVNINKFHEINEYYGFDIGDSVLLQMADLLLETFAETVEVYRINNDEFALVADLDKISFDSLQESVQIFSEAILMHLFSINTQQIHSEISIPLQITMGMASSEHNILQNAGIALHQAKSYQKELVVFNDDLGVEKSYKENFEMIKTVRDAIMDERIIAHYQPIVDNQTQKIVKYEALVRLIDMQKKILSPAVFLDVAKKGRLYPYLTRAVFQQACELFVKRSESFTINIELEDIVNPATNSFILDTIGKFSSPERIVIEIVESQRLERNPMVEIFIDSVQKKGAKIAIDDFGTGYSNFEYLLHLHPDIIKIDGSLIQNIDDNKEKRVVVESIVEFSKKMGIKTVAEFVSSESVYHAVRSMGITYSQGYYFGKPEMAPAKR